MVHNAEYRVGGKWSLHGTVFSECANDGDFDRNEPWCIRAGQCSDRIAAVGSNAEPILVGGSNTAIRHLDCRSVDVV
jgi:hypothetical protein